MKRPFVILAVGILFSGCVSAPTSTRVTGYGQGKTMADATERAWHNAAKKLQIGGLQDYTLTDELLQNKRYLDEKWVVTISFKAVPSLAKASGESAVENSSGEPLSRHLANSFWEWDGDGGEKVFFNQNHYCPVISRIMAMRYEYHSFRSWPFLL
jgi:hypothetical protein